MEIIIHPHSFVDLITNSSTEIFVANRGHTLEQVQEIVDILEKVFWFADPYREGISVDRAYLKNEEQESYYYGNKDAVIIRAERGSVHPQMIALMERIFDSGERNEEAPDY